MQQREQGARAASTATSREAFINHLLKENLEREDFDVIERARGVEQLVTVCEEAGQRGARTRAAEQLGKDRSWVTNQLILLELPAELQAMLSAGSLAERDGRTLARYAKENPGLEAPSLLDHLKAEKEAEALAKAEDRRKLQALRSADNKPADKPVRSATMPPAQRKPPLEPVGSSSTEATSDATEQGNADQPRKLPYDDAFYIVHHLHVKMATADFV
jgi:ParB family chromosome partitioning protein